jgi:hypothetical protein
MEGPQFHQPSNNQPVTTAIIQKVAKREDVDPTELPPLYGAINTDALEGLFDDTRGSGSAGHVKVEIVYLDYHVIIENEDVRIKDDLKGPPS